MTIPTNTRALMAETIDPTAFNSMTGHTPVQRQSDALAKADAILALLHQRVGDGGWRPISEAPHACHVLATRFDDCEWIVAVVASPPSRPFTHWQPLPPPPSTPGERDA